MRTQMLFFCLGLALLSRWSVLPALPVPLLCAAILVQLLMLSGVFYVRVCRPQTGANRWQKVFSALLCFTLGLSWALYVAISHHQRLLPAELEGIDLWVTGHISNLPAVSGRVTQFEFRVHDNCFRLLPADCDHQPSVLRGSRIRLSHYGNEILEPGQIWRFRVRLNRPHGLANPGGRDGEAALFRQRISARGYVRETSMNELQQGSRRSAQTLRFWVAALLEKTFASHPDSFHHEGLLMALIIGERTGISTQQWQLFTATGTNHLVVISGLHIGFVALSCYWLLNLLSRMFPALLRRWPAQHIGALAAIAGSVVYAALAGFSLPTQRALIMLTVLMASRLLGRRVPSSYSLLLAASLVLMKDPLSVTQAGFWLSFVAVASLLFAFSAYRHAPAPAVQSVWQSWVRPQWSVSIGLLLPLLLWMGQVSVVSPVVNILAIPLVSLMVVPLALLGVLLLLLLPSVGVLLLKLADTLLGWFVDGLTLVVDSGAAVWHSGALVWPLPVFVGLACIVLLMPRGIVPKWLALPLLLPLWWSAEPTRPPPGHVQLQFLDVGQGLAVVVHTHSHDLLFDTGPADGERFDAGHAVIIPYLRHRSVSRLAKVIVSHWHQDHSGGLVSVLREVPADNLLSGSGQSQVSSIQVARCLAGQQWQWDEVKFSMLGPADRPYRNINDGSCVLLIEAGSHRALLTGDIEREAENHLLLQFSAGLRADVLQAPHHGSNSSSTEAFLQAVQPSLVVISAGYRNRFSHPSTEVLRRYAEHDVEVYQNVRDGAVQVELGGDEVRVSARYRLLARRYWHNIP